MFPITKFCKIIFIVLILPLLVAVNTQTRNSFAADMVKPDTIKLIVGKSIIKNFEELNIQLNDADTLQIQVGSPDIAEHRFLEDDKILIIGKKAGVTNMILSLKGKKTIGYFDIEVRYDLSRLKQELHRMMPFEKNINVMASNDAITLYGKVSHTMSLSKALALAESYVPKEKINNLLKVGGIHQVMLEVKMAEISRTITKELGIDVAGVNLMSGNYFNTTLGGVMNSAAANLAFSSINGDVLWDVAIKALKENGLIKILAEPNLITLSGQTASFLAGGEYPIPFNSDDDTITVIFKEYGVGLSFTPSVLDDNKISIEVLSSVSELDFSTSVQFTGFVLPGLSTRKVSTMVELADGQSFAIAGLLSESVKEKVKKYPFLGDIPILGTLFKSTSFQKSETELIIIVTPRLVKPMDAGNQPVPTDYYTEPGDAEIFFNLTTPGNRPSQPAGSGADLDGQFGHSFETE